MKIGFITPVLAQAGGIGRVAEEYAMRLAARGHEVTVFTPAKKDLAAELIDRPQYLFRCFHRSEEIFNTPEQRNHHCETTRFFRCHWLRPQGRWGFGAWVPSLVSRLEGFEIAHLHYPFLGGAETVAWWRRSSKTPLVLTYHMDLVGRGLWHLPFRCYQRWLMPWIVRSADQVLVSSMDYAKQGDLGRLALGFSSLGDRLVELPFGVDLNRFQPWWRDQPSAWGSRDTTLDHLFKFPSGVFVFIFVGGLDQAHYFKGLMVLLRAFARCFRNHLKARLLIVGQGEKRQFYEESARRLGLGAAVHFTGAVDEASLPVYYHQAHCLVLPSIDRSEAFGLVLLEAQAAGLPVIASALPGVRTLIEEAKTGFLVEPNNEPALVRAMEQMIDQGENRKLMAAFAYQRIQDKYEWEPLIERLESIYRGL